MRINAQQDNVAGVKIPRFERVMTGASDTKMHLTGLGKGGQQVQQCRKVLRVYGFRVLQPQDPDPTSCAWLLLREWSSSAADLVGCQSVLCMACVPGSLF